MTYYRLNEDWTLPGRDEPLKAGTLLFTWRASSGSNDPRLVSLSEREDGWGCMLAVPKDVLAVAPPPVWRDFPQLLKFYFIGSDVPPNIVLGTADTLEADLNSIAHRGALSRSGVGCSIGGRLRLPGMDRGEMALGMADHTQGGNVTGDVVALLHLSSWRDQISVPRTVRFALCKHEKKAGASANPQRGWHPGHCTKCGLDMTVDSGD